MYDWKGKMDSDQDNQVSVLHTDRKEKEGVMRKIDMIVIHCSATRAGCSALAPPAGGNAPAARVRRMRVSLLCKARRRNVDESGRPPRSARQRI